MEWRRSIRLSRVGWPVSYAEAKYGSVIVVVAVLAFQAAISFELTRRENDKKILALHVEMSDMMTVVGL